MAKKKAPRPTIKTSAKTKKNAEPKSNVRVRTRTERETTPAKVANKKSTATTQNAKSGLTAAQKAEEIKYQNQKARNSAVSRIKTIKIGKGGMGGLGAASLKQIR